MIVNLRSIQIVQLEAFKREIAEFPVETREDVFSLVHRFLKGERLNSRDFKTFKIDKNTKIQEFKVKDSRGNWRAISTMKQGKYLVFVYAFNKKSQELLEKDKDAIRNRIKRIKI
ncbi:MAG: type II toxin-antitoxin system RelE/ParE family toxin [Bdellovibrionia bacterium]